MTRCSQAAFRCFLRCNLFSVGKKVWTKALEHAFLPREPSDKTSASSIL
jgi:hypothetical protein